MGMTNQKNIEWMEVYFDEMERKGKKEEAIYFMDIIDVRRVQSFPFRCFFFPSSILSKISTSSYTPTSRSQSEVLKKNQKKKQ